MDYNQRNNIFDSILTDICCGLSILFLILTILLVLIPINNKKMTLTEKLKDRRNFITFSLCFCLITSNILIIFGMDNLDIKPIVMSIIVIIINHIMY